MQIERKNIEIQNGQKLQRREIRILRNIGKFLTAGSLALEASSISNNSTSGIILFGILSAGFPLETFLGCKYFETTTKEGS